MTVLHCIPGMGGGGAERQLAYLAGPLRGRGWRVHVALASGGPNLSRLEAGGASIHRLTSGGNYDPRLAWQILRIIRRVRPDLVQVWFAQMTLLAGVASELLGVPWVVSERSSAPAYPRSLKNWLRVTFGQTADAVISNSSGGDAYWQQHLDSRIPRFVIPNALPLGEIDRTIPALPGVLPVAASDDVVLFAGRFDVEKNLPVLVTALREIVERPRTVAVLCGDGPLRAEIEARIAGEGLGGRVFSLGYASDLWSLMKRAAAVVSAAQFEGRPNTVLEAMAARRPLVVSDIPAHREILDEASALLVDPADPGAISRAVLWILDDRPSAQRRADLAHRRVAAFGVDMVAAEYDRVYRLVVENAKKS